MIPTSKLQEAAKIALGASAFAGECTDYEQYTEYGNLHGIKITTPEYVIKLFHKKYKTRSREFALDILTALLPEAMRRTVEEALSIAEHVERNKVTPNHVAADRYEAARKALRR